MVSLGRALEQYDWWSYKKRTFGHRHRGKTPWRHREKTAIYKSREEAFRRNQACRYLDVRCLTSRIVQKINFCCLSHPVSGSLWKVCNRSLRKYNFLQTSSIIRISPSPLLSSFSKATSSPSWIIHCLLNSYLNLFLQPFTNSCSSSLKMQNSLMTPFFNGNTWWNFFLCVCIFFGLHLRHAEVSRLGIKSELQLDGLCHSHSNARSEPHLQSRLQLEAMPDP